MNSQLHPLEIIITGDGSPSLINKALQATYHSKHGAIQESKHIFIQHGLIPAIEKFGHKLSLFELGFGTGLNAILSAIEASKNHWQLHYTGIEKFPLNKDLYKALHLEKQFDMEQHHIVQNILESKWQQWQSVSSHFQIKKVQGDILDYPFDTNYHLIYFDAFAPETNPELWSKDILEKVYRFMLQGGIMVTFCAKGSFKRQLKDIGFKVESIKGPPGKREMTRAIKI